MTKSKRLTDKLKNVGRFVKNKVILPVVFTTAGIFYSQNADAQIRSEYKDHNKGAKFKEYASKSEDLLEEKVFYNNVTKQNERFYLQHIDKKMYENDLDITSLPFYNTMPLMNFKSGNVSHLVSDTAFAYFPIKERSLELPNTHVGDRCDDQIRDIAGVGKGVNFISTSYAKDYFKSLSKDMVLELKDGRAYLVVTLPKEKQIKGKTNHLLIPFDEEHKWGVDPKTKNLWVFGDIYEGRVITDKSTGQASRVVVDGNTGLVAKLGEKDSFADAIQEVEKEKEKIAEKDSLANKKNLYLILGAEGNKNFLGGDLGVQYGPLALVGNMGAGLGPKEVLNITTEASPITGRYGTGTKVESDINVKGLALELHPLHNKKVSPFIGGGLNNWNYTTLSTEQIRAPNGDILKENTNSARNSENSWKAYGGVNFGKNSKVGVSAGWDSKSKGFAGARFSKTLGGRRK